MENVIEVRMLNLIQPKLVGTRFFARAQKPSPDGLDHQIVVQNGAAPNEHFFVTVNDLELSNECDKLPDLVAERFASGRSRYA